MTTSDRWATGIFCLCCLLGAAIGILGATVGWNEMADLVRLLGGRPTG